VSRTDAELLREAKDHLGRLRAHLDRGGIDDDTVFDAVCMRLSAAIECVNSIDPGVRAAGWGVEWSAIWSVRNRIAHGYFWIDRTIIDATVAIDLPEFETIVDALLADLDPAAG